MLRYGVVSLNATHSVTLSRATRSLSYLSPWSRANAAPLRAYSSVMPMRGKRKSAALAEPAAFPESATNGTTPAGAMPSKKPAKGKTLEPKRSATTAVNGSDVAIGGKELPLRAVGSAEDPEAAADPPPDAAEVQDALSRPPPVNSDYLPLPWKGRLGYACLNTYLRSARTPVFSSRTCRIASILEHRHPLKNPDEPEHATKNRPDKDQPADVRRGQKYVEELGLANVRDIAKMLRWNERYGIKFMRLSSEIFPFASHEEYGYKLAPFASEALAEAGLVAGKLGHRLTTHPGQFTQLGSPRKEVIQNSFRDLAYHAEMLDLLKLPPQQDRDAVMILHMGGMFGDKGETLDRFRKNYATLPANVKKRLVLENDDMGWSVHDLLPICEELNIPMVLDYHHHNIVFDADQIREGTKDIMALYPRILKTWEKKNITPKMHYSEPTPPAITPRQRRKHSPRVATLPPCPPNMDLMIEAKDKEQAVFELMRIFKLPGYDLFSDVIPFVREDESRSAKPYTKKELKDGAAAVERGEPPLPERTDYVVPAEEESMGGPLGRVYWPPGMEEWLRPEKVVRKAATDKKAPTTKAEPAKVKAEEEDDDVNEAVVPTPKPTKKAAKPAPPKPAAKNTPVKKTTPAKPKAVVKEESFDEDENMDEESSEAMPDDLSAEEDSDSPPPKKRRAIAAKPVPTKNAANGRASRGRKRVSYREDEESE